MAAVDKAPPPPVAAAADDMDNAMVLDILDR
jgi:hypothetical protein